jgi:CRP-like cAMP-binding protein
MRSVNQVDIDGLRRTTLFSPLDREDAERFVEQAQVTEHTAGELLTDQGSVGHRFHLLLDGGAEVERDGAVVATIGPGDFVGELGLLGGGPSTATVRCATPTRCLTLEREAFWSVLEAEPAIALRILEVLCRRLVRQFRTGHTSNLLGDE